MAQIFRSLDEISSGYSVFEKDQVLSHAQLNSVTDYLDDQSRLTRVDLLGVGIVSGLGISLQPGSSNISLSPGVGITSDGDLLRVPSAEVYDRFRAYDRTKPAYAPLYVKGIVAGEMLPVYELLSTTTSGDNRTELLSDFGAQTDADLHDMALLLFLESYVTDRDLCSGTDCDNLGQEYRCSVRLLLVHKNSTGLLQEQFDTTRQAFFRLDEIVADRPLFPAAANTPALLAQRFRTPCSSIYSQLSSELPKMYPACRSFLVEQFSNDPAPTWMKHLAELNATFAEQPFGIQYYYDFLKDLAETWNAFRYLLADEQSCCCPDPASFPKHLLLGNLTGSRDQEQNRTGFYPSPLTSRTIEQLQQARFLAVKFDRLIRTFQLPKAQAGSVRITPSLSDEQPLEERAIPYYYRIDSANPIQQSWNFQLHRRGLDSSNYSYNAAQYGARGAAANPLAAQIGRFPFFRIEGHLGQPVKTVLAALQKEITSWNLPIALLAVALGPDRSRVVKRPGIRYTDLHRLHYLLRQDVSHQLEETVTFSQNFKQKLNKAVRENIVSDAPDDDAGIRLKNIAKAQNAAVARNATQVRAKLNRSYSSYAADATWKQNVAPAIQAAGEFKAQLSDVVKTEFATPFDALIGTSHIQWIDWLDDIIKARDQHEDDQQLFTNFVSRHPGIAHAAGVPRGGTFVLVHDEQQLVVADFMLPYYCDDTIEEEPPQPPLKKPAFRPGWIVGNGISLLPSRDKLIKDKLNIFKNDQIERILTDRLASFKLEHLDVLKENLDIAWNRKFDTQQKEYFGTMKESVSLLGSALISRKAAAPDVTTGSIGFTDRTLELKINDSKEKQMVADYLQKKAVQSDLPAETRVVYEQQAKEAQDDLATSIIEATRYVADSKADISVGGEGMAAILELHGGLQSITDSAALAVVSDGFTAIKSGQIDAGMNVIMDSMIALRRR